MALGRSDARSRRWADLRQRAASALVLAPIALAGVWMGGAVFAALVGLLTLGLVVEWVRLCRAGAESRAWLPAGIAWIALAGFGMAWLRADPLAGRANVIFVLVTVWASDIGAYAVGRLVGGKRLAPRISPGKTWSGAAGGLLAAGATGICLAKVLAGSGDPWIAALLGAGLSVAGQGGDLLESRVKRRFGVKDSGRLIPGHGGLLDRLDAALAAVPIAALLALALGRGVILWQ